MNSMAQSYHSVHSLFHNDDEPVESEILLDGLHGDSLYAISVRQRPAAAAGKSERSDNNKNNALWTEVVHLEGKTETSRKYRDV